MFPLRPARVASLLRASVCIGLLGGALACQDGEIDEDQVCAFQCDYTFGSDPGFVGDPETAARLTERDVVQVIANAIVEANANGIFDLTVVVNDHLNNVLAVYDSDASTIDYSLITSLGDPGSEVADRFDAAPGPGTNVDFGPVPATDALNTALDGIFIPAGYAAISKAGTANYFSTQGNAFSSRTASNLIQQNFFPGETDRPGGPLFAVQIAQLACSDINTRQTADPTDLIGPRRLPVGFAADPGGLPLYKDGIPELDANGVRTGRTGKVVVGAVGIEFNGIYSLDKEAIDRDRNLEERIAVAATRGFEADPERRANRITVAGRALRFFDDGGLRSRAGEPVTAADVVDGPTILAFLDTVSNAAGPARIGVFVNDRFFFPFDQPRAGVFFLEEESGVISETLAAPPAAAAQGLRDAQGEILVDSVGAPRFPAIPSANPTPVFGGLDADEVQELLVNALLLAERTRAQTRTPLGGQARIDVAVVDLDGNVLGFARSQDALLDGIDVTIAKTRQAAFWSKANARTQLEEAVDPLGNAGLLNTRAFDAYVDDTAAFLGLPPPVAAADAPFNGDIAWSSIGLGGIANPDFPPGVLDADEGPLSRADGEWSIFSTGIQTEVVLPGIALALCEEVPDLANVLGQVPALAGIVPPPSFAIDANGTPQNDTFCAQARAALIGSADPAQQLDCLQGVQAGLPGDPLIPRITGLQNGFHIFQGAVPIYRGDTLIGAFGVSGDGAEQDDFVPFVALDEVGKSQQRRGVSNPIGNAPKPIRADRVEVQNINLRYVVCPVAPLLTSNDQTVCEGR